MSLSRRGFLAGSAAVVATHKLDALPASSPPAASARAFDPWLEIDSSAIAHNVRTIARLTNKPIIAVAKNNAYGCGIATVAPILERLPEISGFAVVRVDEALALRAAGAKKPILLMGPASDDEAIELARRNVHLAPYAADHAGQILRVAKRLGRAVRVHLYVDTGMHRMGMPHDRMLSWLDDSSLRKAMVVDGALSELTEDQDFDREQASRLRTIAERARAKGVPFGRLHAASSDAIAQSTTETFLDAVRPGITIYGGYPTPEMRARGELVPAFRLKARVIRVDQLAAGEGASYHRRFRASEPTRTATLALGHVDGYPTGAVKGCSVLIRGKLRPVLGTVSASHTLVSLGDDASVQVGDEAIAVGPDDPAIHPNEVAKRSDWSEYNMFMHLNQSLRRTTTS